ncbi:hypothetical protein ACFE6N_00355 [Pedobacter sp. BG31]
MKTTKLTKKTLFVYRKNEQTKLAETNPTFTTITVTVTGYPPY